MSWLRRRIGDAPRLPLVVLPALNGIDQFDVAAFGLLAPEIVADFHTDATTFGYLLLPQLLLALVSPAVFGILADRTSRVTLTVVGALAWGATCIFTGLAPTILVLGLARTLATVARGPAVAHLSLIPDYYPTQSRGFAYACYNATNTVGQAAGLLAAGLIAETMGWRPAFILLGIPGLVIAAVATRLREPERGRVDAEEAGLHEAPAHPPLGPIRAARLLLRIPTFKRLAWSGALIFAAVSGSGVALSFYFSSVFEVSPATRGVISFIPLPIGMVTLFMGASYAEKWLGAGRNRLVVRMGAATMAVSALGYAGLALAPTVAVAVLISTTVAAVSSFALIPLQMLIAQLVPPHVRSQGFGVFNVFLFMLSAPALVFGLDIGNRLGFRSTTLLFAPIAALGAVMMWWAGSTADRDIARNRDVIAAQVTRRERLAEHGTDRVLEVRGVDAGYGDVQILFDVDMHLDEGEILALLGTNGAGKSTLLRVIGGLLVPTSGSVLLDGEDVTGLDTEVLAERGIVQMPGGRGIFPGLTVARNLELATYLRWNEPEACEAAIAEVLDLFPRLGERLGQIAGTLSGGEQQMLALAQAFVSRPRVLMIDELSLGLAPIVVDELLTAVREINDRGVPVILVEQSVNVAMTLADRAYFMEKGEVRFEGRTKDLLGRTDLVRSIFLEGAGRRMGAAG